MRNPVLKKQSPHASWLIALIIGNVLLGFIYAWFLAHDYRETGRVAELRVRNLTALITGNLEPLFGNIELALATAVAEPVTGPASESRRIRLIDAIALADPEIRNMTVHGADGAYVGGRLAPDGKPYSIAGRPYFDTLRNAADHRTVVFGPVPGRSNNRLSMVFARRLTTPDGRFAGVVLVGYAVDRLSEKIVGLGLDTGDAVIIRAPDLTVAAVVPRDFPLEAGSKVTPPLFAEALSTSPDKGFMRRSRSGASDRVDRMFAYERTPTFGFYVSMTRRVDRIYAGFQQQMFILGALLLALWSGSAVIARSMNRKDAEYQRTTGEQSQRLRQILDASIDGYWRTSNDGHLKEVNEVYASLSGYAVAELLQMRIADLEVIEDETQVAAHMDKITSAGHDRFETRHRRKDGSIWDVEVSVMAGDGIHIHAFLRDVSERKKLQRQIMESRELLRRFLDHLPATAFVKDAESRVLVANMGFRTLLGLDPHEMVGRRSDEIFPGPLGEKIVADDLRILAMGKTEVIEETYAGRIFESTKFVIDGDETRLLGGLTLDMTKQVRNRQRFEALLELAEYDSTGVEKELLTYALEKAEALTGSKIGFLHFVNDDQETIELVTWTAGALKGCQAAYDNHYPISQAGIWADCFRERRAVYFNDYAGYAAKKGLPEGHAPLHRLISVPVIEDGFVRMMMGVGNKDADYDEFDVQSVQLIGNDLWRIARRRRAEQSLADRVVELSALNDKLAQAQSQLLQSEKMSSIGQLAAGVAHELNNPIGFIQSNLGTLEGYVKDMLEVLDFSQQCAESCALPGKREALEKQREAKDIDFIRGDVMQLLAESKDGADRVRRIVQNLKDFSHVSEEEWQWADVHKGLDSTLNLVWNELKYKAEVEKQYGELPRVFCMASQLNQVFMNLLVNAAHAIETRGKITIATGTAAGTTAEDTIIWVEIRDTGKGMTPEVMKRIFEPFYTTKPVGKGTGLGLSLAWSIIEKHHGRIEVDSKVGEGTVFRITVPVNQADKGSQ